MSEVNQTTIFAMRRTVFGSNLLDFIESVGKPLAQPGAKDGLKVGFFPTSDDSFDNRAVHELSISAMSVRRRVAVLYLDPQDTPAELPEGETLAIEAYIDDAAAMDRLPRQRQLIMRATKATPGSSSELNSKGLAMLIARLGNDYDLTLIVSSHQFKSSLGVAIANTCDQCYLFVRQGTTTVRQLDQTRTRLQLSDARTQGVIYTGRRRLIPEGIYRLLFTPRRATASVG